MKAALFVCLAAVLFFPPTAFAQGEQATAVPVVTESLVILFPTSTQVDRPVTQTVIQPTTSARGSLRTPISVWAASVAADQVTTYLFSSRYQGVLHETNPLIRGLDKNPVALVAAGTALDVATGFAAYKLLHNHPRLAKVVFYGAAAFRTYLAFYNMRMMQRAQALQTAARTAAVR